MTDDMGRGGGWHNSMQKALGRTVVTRVCVAFTMETNDNDTVLSGR